MKEIGQVEIAFFIWKPFDSEGAFSIARYPLNNLLILDCGNTIYIFNEIACFINYQPAIHGDFVWAGDHKVQNLGYGEVNIEI
jgi:hypothetical protein